MSLSTTLVQTTRQNNTQFNSQFLTATAKPATTCCALHLVE